MQSANKAMVAGLLGGAVIWSGTRYLPWGFEGGLLCGWAAVLPDIDSAYEYAAKHVEHAPAVLAVPFGRLLGDHLHSKYRVKFLHSFMGLAFFYLAARSAALLPVTPYVIFELIIATWAAYSLERYLFHSLLRSCSSVQTGTDTPFFCATYSTVAAIRASQRWSPVGGGGVATSSVKRDAPAADKSS